MPTPSQRTLAERLYALGLRLYPRAFRRDYGDALQQAFRDRRRTRSKPTWRVLSDTVRDLAGSLAIEHWCAQREASFTRNAIASALVLVLAGSVTFQAQLREHLGAALDAGLATPGKALASIAERRRAKHLLTVATELSKAPTAREALAGMHMARIAHWLAIGTDTDPAPTDVTTIDALTASAPDDVVALQLAASLCVDTSRDCSVVPAMRRLL